MLITKDIVYVGVDDWDIDLFEGQYAVKNGMCYHSYVVLDEHIAVIDTVDERFGDRWLEHIKGTLGELAPHYLIIQHMEPDHSANITRFIKEYPDATVVATAKAFDMMKAFYADDFAVQRLVVIDGDTLSLGRHKLNFITAPMVHWPEVMMTYDSTDQVLFSADAFGKFGVREADEPWEGEAARYYFGIVAKYGAQVSRVLERASALDIRIICPSHGPILRDDLSRYMSLYQQWASYEPDEDGVVIAYTSIYGHTKAAVKELVGRLHKPVITFDLARCDMHEAVAAAFRHPTLVLATTTYNTDVFPPMVAFLHALASRNFQKRRIAMIENGAWAPTAATVMHRLLSTCGELHELCDPVTIHASMNEDTRRRLRALAAIVDEN